MIKLGVYTEEEIKKRAEEIDQNIESRIKEFFEKFITDTKFEDIYDRKNIDKFIDWLKINEIKLEKKPIYGDLGANIPELPLIFTYKIKEEIVY